MQYKPTFNRVLITEVEAKSSSIIVSASKTEVADGVIVALGEAAGIRDGHVQQTLDEGQHIKFSRSKAVPVELEGTNYLLILDEHIIFVK